MTAEQVVAGTREVARAAPAAPPGAAPASAALPSPRAATWSRLADLACLALAVVPLLALAGRGALRVPLWMDEVNYLVYALEPQVREASPGRPVTPLQGAAYSLFSYPALMRPYLHLLEGAGVDPWRDPELLVRLPSLAASLLAAGVTFALARRRGRLVATLAAGAFASMPLFQYYAFEGRVYALAGAAGLLYLGLASGLGGAPSRLRLAATAALSAALPWLSVWCVPYLAGPGVAWAAGRRWPHLLPGRARLGQVLLCTLPGLAVAALQLWFLAGDFSYQTRMRYSGYMGLRLAPRMTWELWGGPAYLGSQPAFALLVAAGALVALAVALLAVGLPTRRLPAAGRSVVLHWLAAVVVLVVLGGAVRGFVPGRYEVPVVFGLLAAVAQLPRRAAVPLLAAMIGLGTAATGSTAVRIAQKSNTRPMMAYVLEHGDPQREGLLVRHQFGWDPLHRYTGWLYLERRDPRWRARTYPRLEPLADDFMLFDTVVDSPASRRLLSEPDDPRVVEWVRREGLDGVWVLAPDSVDPRRLEELLGEAGLGLRQRLYFGGNPESWLLRYRRAEGVP